VTRAGRAARAGAGLLAALAGAGACEGVLPEPDLERMIDQRNLRPYESSPLFADGRAMRSPPAGTVSRDSIVGQPALTGGMEDGRYVTRIPIPVDVALMRRGRDRFDIYCAACHGVRGDGVAAVARAMELRRPPSLLAPPVPALPPGRLFQVVSLGYGLMPAYAEDLPIADRWATVAYLQALQLSQSVALDALPPDWRQRAQEALR